MRTREVPYQFSNGHIFVSMDVDGPEFKNDVIGIVLDELMRWTIQNVATDLVSDLNELCDNADSEGSITITSDTELDIDHNSFKLHINVELAAKVAERPVRSAIARRVTGQVVEHFAQLVADKLAEGSIPNDASFRQLSTVAG